MVFETKGTKEVAELFQGWQESLIWSCLQGVMGHIYVTTLEHPRSALAVLGDFGFLAGVPDGELLLYEIPSSCRDFCILVPSSEAWEALVEETYQEKAKKVTRYAIKKEPGIFDLEKLQSIVSGLPEDYQIALIDQQLYQRCLEIPWCQDFVSSYEDYAQYEKWGLGVVILKDGEIVSGASSYSSYQGGIEIEIATDSAYRRKGLASICGAKLILECQKRGWYPNWDAQNLWSVALAEKLGYHYAGSYTAYEVVLRNTENVECVVVSACLLGENCKYSGGNNYNEKVAAFTKGKKVIPVCPEVMGGLPTPRIPAEIVDGVVTMADGRNVDREFRQGAQRAMEIVRQANPDLVILQSRSPSCGLKEIYDGTFTSQRIPGQGIFAANLLKEGYPAIDVEDL